MFEVAKLTNPPVNCTFRDARGSHHRLGAPVAEPEGLVRGEEAAPAFVEGRRDALEARSHGLLCVGVTAAHPWRKPRSTGARKRTADVKRVHFLETRA